MDAGTWRGLLTVREMEREGNSHVMRVLIPSLTYRYKLAQKKIKELIVSLLMAKLVTVLLSF